MTHAREGGRRCVDPGVRGFKVRGFKDAGVRGFGAGGLRGVRTEGVLDNRG